MDYEQVYRIPYAGLAARYLIDEEYTAGAWIMFSDLASCDATDHHYRALRDFHDSMTLGYYFAVGASLGRRVSEFSRISFSLEYTAVPEFKGDSYTVMVLTGMKSSVRKNGAAAGYGTLNLTLSLVTRIEWE